VKEIDVMTADRARWIVLGSVGLLLVFGLVATGLALAQPGGSLRADVTLWIALAALILTVAKVVIDMRVRQLVGLSGTVIEARAQEAWGSHDTNQLAEAAKALGDLAEQAYHEMEATSDPLEILVGVLMVEAWALADRAPKLADVPPEDWPGDTAARHLSNVTDYLEQVQHRLHEIQDRGRVPD
jgi:hypothetical protein